MENTFERILKFIERKRWKYNFPLTKETRMEEDLKIFGDDAIEILISFGKEFNVDVSNFLADDYFNDEGVGAAGTITRFISFRNPKPNKKTLTLGHLEKSVMAGRLDEDVINS